MTEGGNFSGTSRETLLLVNNLLLTVIAAMVLTGTLYPLLLDALDAGKISVGPPYFGLLFGLFLVPIVVLLPLAFHARWQEDSLKRIAAQLWLPALAALLGAIATVVWLPDADAWGIAGAAGSLWIMVASLQYYARRMRAVPGRLPSRSETAMTLAHFGVGLFLVGASLTNVVSDEKHLRMEAGDSFELSGYTFVFEGTRGLRGPNFVADEGEFIIYKSGERVAALHPQKRLYGSGQTMTEAAIDPGLMRDLYISLGEPLDENGQVWAVRIYHKAFIRFIWLGALLMMAGGFLAASDRRYRRVKERKEASDRATEGAAAEVHA